MSHCPICGVTTSDLCGMGGVGTGTLPDDIKKLNEDEYHVWAYEHDGEDGGYGYSVERKHIMCDLCATLGYIARHDYNRALKIAEHIRVKATMEEVLQKHSGAWKELADM